MKKNFKNAFLTTTAAAALIAGATLINTTDVQAHGFMIGDRAHLTHSSMGNLNRINRPGTPTWDEPLQFEPQSAGELFGLRHVERGLISLNDAITARDGNTHLVNPQAFAGLADTGADRWARIPMNGGPNEVRWHFTAPHRTDEIVYYISKAGFDPSQPLDINDFEKVASFSEGGRQPNVNTTHTINLPTDRSGSHVLLAAWHLADNYVSWYRVMDIDLINDGTVVEPSLPEDPDLGDFDPCDCDYSDGDHEHDHNHNPDRLPDVPEVNLPGNNVGDTWSPYTVYFGGEIVVYAGHKWQAMWWTQNDRPGSTGEFGVWRLVGAANAPQTPDHNTPATPEIPDQDHPATPESPAQPEIPTQPEIPSSPSPSVPDVTDPEIDNAQPNAWRDYKVYIGGEVVVYGGNQWQAMWWTQGERPGTTGEWGVWRLVGPAKSPEYVVPELPATPDYTPDVVTPEIPEVTAPEDSEIEEPSFTSPEEPEVIAPEQPSNSDFEVGRTFTAGEVVNFNGNEYRAIVTFTYWGDSTWLPNPASTLWVRN